MPTQDCGPFGARDGYEKAQKLDESASEFAAWEDPALVFSQTCGMPYPMRLHPNVRLIETPDTASG